MNPFGLPDHQLAAFARPVLDYLPAGYDPEDAVQAEIDDVGSLADLALPDVVTTRIRRLGVDVSTGNMTERLLDASAGSTVISGLRYRDLDPAFPFVAVKTTARVNDAESADTLAAQVAEAYRGASVASHSGSSQASTCPPQRGGQQLWPGPYAWQQELTSGT